MNPSLAALLPTPPQAGTSATSASTPSTPAPSPTDPTSGAQFKSQFDQAVAALQQATGSNSTQGTTTTGAAQATAGSSVQSAVAADVLQEALQKKIADLLAKGESVSEIVQQLAASLASSLVQQFGGDATQVQNQLQTAIASALSPPSTTGPPLSNADLASALAQQFRQVADVAAGVLGETGQSNRLFAGSISDAATTAGVQPAPTSDNNPTPADSIANDASALLASLTASQGDGKTVATNGAPALGPNGDTLLGRILARAAQSQIANASQTPALASAAPNRLVSLALAAATAALSGDAASAPAPTVASTSVAPAISVIADAASASATNSGSTASVLATDAPAPLSPAVLAFVKAFTDALATTSSPTTAKAPAGDTDPGALLNPASDSSSQAPTIGAFAAVQAAAQNDAASADGAQTPTSASFPSQTTVDPNAVVAQLLHGLSLNTTDSTSTVRMRLVPEELGDISVKLTIEGSSVSAQVMAQTPAAHDALVAGQAQLSRQLADSGLKLTSFNVDLAGGFASFQQQQQQQSSQNGGSNGRPLLGGVDTPETDDASLVAAPNFGPPVLAGVSWSALNYLV
jgi:flagellar hook-length control protein FliK